MNTELKCVFTKEKKKEKKKKVFSRYILEHVVL